MLENQGRLKGILTQMLESLVGNPQSLQAPNCSIPSGCLNPLLLLLPVQGAKDLNGLMGVVKEPGPLLAVAWSGRVSEAKVQ